MGLGGKRSAKGETSRKYNYLLDFILQVISGFHASNERFSLPNNRVEERKLVDTRANANAWAMRF